MHILENVSLKNHSTMQLGGRARWLAEAHTEDEVQELFENAKSKNLNFIMIGQGSNIVWRDEGFSGLVIVNKIMGRQIISQDSLEVTVKIGGGENWDEVVKRAVSRGWSGIEFLSKIPGTAGAAPVQNIGAYGAELSETLLEVEAFDTKKESFIKISNEACGFSYRNSRFKTRDKGRFLITKIVLRLRKTNPKPPFYEALEEYFKQHPADKYTPAEVRQAVTAIRAVKLPDPSLVKNNGSFFTNPLVSRDRFEELKTRYPGIKGWPAADKERVKLAAGWLVEQAGFKDMHDPQTGMATWKGSALVMVNENARTTADLLAFKMKITDKVAQMFGVNLEQEPELLP